jgi:hypothetical protein
MPFIDVFTREKLSDEIRAKLAEELGNTAMTIEFGALPSPRSWLTGRGSTPCQPTVGRLAVALTIRT